jgi:hypothetical protein
MPSSLRFFSLAVVDCQGRIKLQLWIKQADMRRRPTLVARSFFLGDRVGNSSSVGATPLSGYRSYGALPFNETDELQTFRSYGAAALRPWSWLPCYSCS